MPSVSAEQVASKLKKPCDSLLTDDSAECKEQKSKLDLISRAELRKAFCKINDLRTLSLGKVGEIIDSVPSADAVEVVRCKDCRHGWYDDDIEYYTCRHPKGLNEELYGVDFCSYGERKGGTK